MLLMIGCAHVASKYPVLDDLTAESQSHARPQFSAGYINVASPEAPKQGKVMAFISIPYPGLRFKKIARKKWQAAYPIEAQLKYQNVQLDYYSFAGKTIVLTDYFSTVNPMLCAFHIIEYSLPQARYELNIRIANKSSKESSYLSMPVLARKIKWGSFDISDPVFFSHRADGERFFNALHEYDSLSINVIPLDPQMLKPEKTVNIVFEAYYPPEMYQSLANKKVIVKYELLFKNKPVFRQEKEIEITDETKQRQIVNIELNLPDTLGSGEYVLTLCTSADNMRSYTVSKLLCFNSFFPRTKQEMKNAFKATEIIAPRAVKARLKKAKANEDKLSIFTTFWEKQNYMVRNEFSARLAFVLKEYGAIRNIKSEIILKFGFPVEATTITFTPNILVATPIDPVCGDETLEIWHYCDLGSAVGRDYKMFVFPKQTGFGYSFNTMKYHRTNGAELADYDPEEIFK